MTRCKNHFFRTSQPNFIWFTIFTLTTQHSYGLSAKQYHNLWPFRVFVVSLMSSQHRKLKLKDTNDEQLTVYMRYLQSIYNDWGQIYSKYYKKASNNTRNYGNLKTTANLCYLYAHSCTNCYSFCSQSFDYDIQNLYRIYETYIERLFDMNIECCTFSKLKKSLNIRL